MSMPKVIRNIIVVVFMFFMLALVVVQQMWGRYPTTFKTNMFIIAIYIVITVICLWIYLHIRKILKKKNLSKNKQNIFKVSSLFVLIVLSRLIFGLIFINNKLDFSDLTLVHKDLVGFFPFEMILVKLFKKINLLFRQPALTVYIVNTLFFTATLYMFRKTLKLIISSELITAITTIIFILHPKFMYYSLFITPDIIYQMILVAVLFMLTLLIKEIKKVNVKNNRYIIYTILLSLFMAIYCVLDSNVWVCLALILLLTLYVGETSASKFRVSSKKIKKANYMQKAKLNKIKGFRLRKIVVVDILLLILYPIFLNIVILSLNATTHMNFYGYKPNNYPYLFTKIDEKTAREEIINSNFKETLQKSTGEYNIGNSLNNIINLNKKGKLRESSKLSKTLAKTIMKKDNTMKNFSSVLSNDFELVKSDININKALYKKVKNQNVLSSILKFNNFVYKSLFIAILIAEIIHIILKRKRDVYSITIRVLLLISIFKLLFTASNISTTIVLSTLALLILSINIAGIYYNRDDKIKLLNPSTKKY